jgi:cytochrome bd-type quinol oxidase subunit 2
MDVETAILLFPLVLGLTAAFNAQGAEIAARRGHVLRHWTAVVLGWAVLSIVPALIVTWKLGIVIEGGYASLSRYYALQLEDYLHYGLWITGCLVFMCLPLISALTYKNSRE